MKKSRFRLGILAIFFSIAPAQSVPIIFDLGGVLIETRYFHSMLNVGPFTMMSYALTFKNPFSCHNKLFEVLEAIQPAAQPLIVKDHYGITMPPLMAQWLKGEVSGDEILWLVDNHLKNHENWIEKLLIKSVAQLIFIPENFAASRYLVPQGVDFVRECKQAGHKLYILSNWDSDSFDYLQALYPDFFNLFDGIVISGDVNVAKPDPAAYKYLTKKYHVNPHSCIFIDDQAENILTAQKLGMHAIHYKKKNSLFFRRPDFDGVREKINAFLDSKNLPAPIN